MINYKLGDLFDLLPYSSAAIKCVPHVCNNIGAWGGGFTKPLTEKWKSPATCYRAWANANGYLGQKPFTLGEHQFVLAQTGGVPQVDDTNSGQIYVANMIAQEGIISPGNPCPINYAALGKCLWGVRQNLLPDTTEIYCPLFGAGLAGGDWNIIEALIKDAWTRHNIPVTVCIHPMNADEFSYLLEKSNE